MTVLINLYLEAVWKSKRLGIQETDHRAPNRSFKEGKESSLHVLPAITASTLATAHTKVTIESYRKETKCVCRLVRAEGRRKK